MEHVTAITGGAVFIINAISVIDDVRSILDDPTDPGNYLGLIDPTPGNILKRGGKVVANILDGADERPHLIPENWIIKPAKRGPGMRYIDPDGDGQSHVRIDRDHVHVTHCGKILGRGGVDNSGSELGKEDPLRHIPLSEWLGRSKWYVP